MTKSSNKSVLDDAIDTRDTADTLLGRYKLNYIPSKISHINICKSLVISNVDSTSHVVPRKQCDEDDYGFASKTSQVGFLLGLGQSLR